MQCIYRIDMDAMHLHTFSLTQTCRQPKKSYSIVTRLNALFLQQPCHAFLTVVYTAWAIRCALARCILHLISFNWLKQTWLDGLGYFSLTALYYFLGLLTPLVCRYLFMLACNSFAPLSIWLCNWWMFPTHVANINGTF